MGRRRWPRTAVLHALPVTASRANPRRHYEGNGRPGDLRRASDGEHHRVRRRPRDPGGHADGNGAGAQGGARRQRERSFAGRRPMQGEAGVQGCGVADEDSIPPDHRHQLLDGKILWTKPRRDHLGPAQSARRGGGVFRRRLQWRRIASIAVRDRRTSSNEGNVVFIVWRLQVEVLSSCSTRFRSTRFENLGTPTVLVVTGSDVEKTSGPRELVHRALIRGWCSAPRGLPGTWRAASGEGRARVSRDSLKRGAADGTMNDDRSRGSSTGQDWTSPAVRTRRSRAGNEGSSHPRAARTRRNECCGLVSAPRGRGGRRVSRNRKRGSEPFRFRRSRAWKLLRLYTELEDTAWSSARSDHLAHRLGAPRQQRPVKLRARSGRGSSGSFSRHRGEQPGGPGLPHHRRPRLTEVEVVAVA